MIEVLLEDLNLINKAHKKIRKIGKFKGLTFENYLIARKV